MCTLHTVPKLVWMFYPLKTYVVLMVTNRECISGFIQLSITRHIMPRSLATMVYVDYQNESLPKTFGCFGIGVHAHEITVHHSKLHITSQKLMAYDGTTEIYFRCTDKFAISRAKLLNLSYLHFCLTSRTQMIYMHITDINLLFLVLSSFSIKWTTYKNIIPNTLLKNS